MRTFSIIALAAFALAPVSGAVSQTITKCQDAEGKWHYGNYASEACGNAPITEMRESGVTLEVRESPPTVEELQARKAAEQAAREAEIKREEKRRIDQALMEKYPSEDVILTLRDQRLVELEKQIAFNRTQLEKLNAERATMPETDGELDKQERHELTQRIDRFRRAIERGLAAIEKTKTDYAKLLERYRQIDRQDS